MKEASEVTGCDLRSLVPSSHTKEASRWGWPFLFSLPKLILNTYFPVGMTSLDPNVL